MRSLLTLALVIILTVAVLLDPDPIEAGGQ